MILINIFHILLKKYNLTKFLLKIIKRKKNRLQLLLKDLILKNHYNDIHLNFLKFL